MRDRVRPSWALLRLLSLQQRDYLLTILLVSILLPGNLLYLMVVIADGDQGPGMRRIAIAITLGLGAALTRAGTPILEDRLSGRLEALRTLPISKRSYFLCRIGIGVSTTLVFVVLALAGVAAAGIVTLRADSLALGLILSAAAAAALAGIGVAVGARVKDLDAGWTVLNIGTIAFALASPVLYEITELPGWARPVAWISPFTHASVQIESVLQGSAIPGTAVLGTLVLCTAYTLLGYRMLEWR